MEDLPWRWTAQARDLELLAKPGADKGFCIIEIFLNVNSFLERHPDSGIKLVFQRMIGNQQKASKIVGEQFQYQSQIPRFLQLELEHGPQGCISEGDRRQSWQAAYAKVF